MSMKRSDLQSPKDCFVLANDVEIPCLALGTMKLPLEEKCAEAVRQSIDECGYRHLDTATRYENEKYVGDGIHLCKIPREQLFVTGKVWNTERGYDKVIKAFEQSLKEFRLDYLDLYLVHWPASENQYDNWKELNRDTWKAMIDLYKSGKVRAIGVSNFMPHHLQTIENMEILPMVNQIEFHPGFTQDETVRYCQDRGILMEAWRPFGKGIFMNDEILNQLATKYGKTVSQIILRWILQKDILPIAKSNDPFHRKQNTEIFDFVLSEEDAKSIDSIECYYSSGQHPDKIDF